MQAKSSGIYTNNENSLKESEDVGTDLNNIIGVEDMDFQVDHIRKSSLNESGDGIILDDDLKKSGPQVNRISELIAQ